MSIDCDPSNRLCVFVMADVAAVVVSGLGSVYLMQLPVQLAQFKGRTVDFALVGAN